MGGMVDEVMSTMAYQQYKYGGIITALFSIVGLGSSIIASEINFFYNDNHSNYDNIYILLSIANISTIALSKTIFL